MPVIPPVDPSSGVTARQIEIYLLHKEACIANGHPQTAFYHRQTEGTKLAVGPQGLNTEYVFPEPRSTDNPKDPAVMLWITWEGLHLRGINQDGGDTMASRMWNERSLVQMPVIDDNYVLITMQDDDFIEDSFGTRFKLENAVLSADGAFYTAIAVVQR